VLCRLTNELSAHVLADSPDHLVFAVPGGPVAGEQQLEFIGNGDPKGVAKRSLRTQDPLEAKQRHLQALAELEAQWANLRAGPRKLTEREAHDLAAIAHDRWLEIHRDNPSEQTLWPTKLGDKVFGPPPLIDWSVPISMALSTEIDWDAVKIKELETWCFTQADSLARARGLMLDADGRAKLAKAVAAAVQRASLTLERSARGEPSPESIWAPGSGVERLPYRAVSRGKPLKFNELIAGWAAEKRPGKKTIYEWERVWSQLASYLGHDDAARLQAEDLIAWKAKMIESGMRPKTIRDAKLAPVRAVLQWAVDNRRLSANPAERLMVSLKVNAGEAKRSFTEDEAAIVLKAALEEVDPVRRWVPWLGAYSGARLSEICQLRVCSPRGRVHPWSQRPLIEVASLDVVVLQNGLLSFYVAGGTPINDLVKQWKRH